MNFLGFSTLGARLAPSQPLDQSAAAYDAIAHEYDSPEHRTTRELERLSCLTIDEPPVADLLNASETKTVVELGCGTGALATQLAGRMRGGHLLISDPSSRMLRKAIRRLDSTATNEDRRPSLIALRATADEILSGLVTPPDLIAAGLADPYLSDSLLQRARQVSSATTHLLVTLPTRRWAVCERERRLRIPLGQTRFRTQEGGTVYSRSLTLEPDELACWMTDNGFRVVAAGAIEAPVQHLHAPPPEVTWALGRPAVSRA